MRPQTKKEVYRPINDRLPNQFQCWILVISKMPQNDQFSKNDHFGNGQNVLYQVRLFLGPKILLHATFWWAAPTAHSYALRTGLHHCHWKQHDSIVMIAIYSSFNPFQYKSTLHFIEILSYCHRNEFVPESNVVEIEFTKFVTMEVVHRHCIGPSVSS